jgi:branched-subunit amino acid aminotransferase/4-amino-4-deoxychorismate lyase
VRERTLTTADLRRASRFWLVNALRGWLEARLR